MVRLVGPGLWVIIFCFQGVTNALGAWEIHSDFRSLIGTDILDKAVQQNFQSFNGEETFQVPDIHTTSNGLPIDIRGIVGRLQYNMASPKRTSSSLIWDTNSSSVLISLSIQSISSSTVIQKPFNGGIINIRVEGSCNNVLMSIPQSAGAKITARVQALLNAGALKLQTVSSAITWPPNSWKVDNLICTGIEGFGTAVHDEALKALAQPQKSVQDGLNSALQKRLNDWSSNATNVALTPRLVFENRNDILIQTSPNRLVSQSNGSVLSEGILKVILPQIGGDNQNEGVSYPFSGSMTTSFTRTEMQTPLVAVKGFIMASLFANAYKSTWTSQEFKPFNDLMQNRSAQSFVFPDLQNFSKTDIFRFDTTAISPPVLRNLHRVSQGMLTADFTLPLQILMQAPRNGTFVPYVQFQARVVGTANFSITDGNLVIQIPKAGVALDYGWNKSYVQQYKPNQHIDDILIGLRLAMGLTANPFNVKMPYWQWQNNTRLVITSMDLVGEQLRFFWDVRENPAANSLAQSQP